MLFIMVVHVGAGHLGGWGALMSRMGLARDDSPGTDMTRLLGRTKVSIMEVILKDSILYYFGCVSRLCILFTMEKFTDVKNRTIVINVINSAIWIALRGHLVWIFPPLTSHFG